MDAIISKLLLVFCVADGAAYFLFTLKTRPYRDLSGTVSVRGFVFHLAFSIVLVAQGVSFLFYYPFNRFGFLADMLSVSFVYAGFVLAYWFKTENQRKWVIFFHTLLLLFLTVWKLFYFTDIPFVARFPLNVCNIIIVFIFLRYFYTNKVLDNVIICLGLAAALTYFFIGSWFDDTAASPGSYGHGFFYYRMFESAILHNLFFSFCIYGIAVKLVAVDVKKTMANMLWIIPYFFVFSFINQVWKTDYFFTGVHGVTPPFLIDLYYFWPLRFTVPIGGRNFDFNILHSCFIIGAAALVLFILSSAVSAVQKRVK